MLVVQLLTLLLPRSAAFILFLGFTDMQISVNEDIYAQFQLNVNVYAEYNTTLAERRILEVRISSSFIPGVIIVGPMITLSVDAAIETQALCQPLAGASYSFLISRPLLTF